MSHSRHDKFQICDADLKILSANARFGGSSHDSFVWNNSGVHAILKREFDDGNNFDSWLLGDSGYGIQPWLMTPILNPNTEEQRGYNERHRRTRHIVERCIGLLKSRFRCISRQRILMYDPATAGLIINSCVVLHNMFIELNVGDQGLSDDNNVNNDNENDDDDIENQNQDEDDLLNQQSPNVLYMNQAVARRNNIVLDYFT